MADPLRLSLDVSCPVEHAFRVWTDRINLWWPADHTVSGRSDSAPPELPSEAVVRGAVQVPHSGQPLVFLADHPTTGGYPVIAVVVDDDTDVLAQLRPGERVRFRRVPRGW